MGVAAPVQDGTPCISLDLDAAAFATGVSRETLRQAILNGDLKGKRSGRGPDGDGIGKYLVSVDALRAWFEGLVDA